jgi:hypothetical protein
MRIIFVDSPACPAYKGTSTGSKTMNARNINWNGTTVYPACLNDAFRQIAMVAWYVANHRINNYGEPVWVAPR